MAQYKKYMGSKLVNCAICNAPIKENKRAYIKLEKSYGNPGSIIYEGGYRFCDKCIDPKNALVKFVLLSDEELSNECVFGIDPL
jgi:hypothetical protein